ncbi:threonine--tRNA ligase [Elusimicrobiota bacterium]
MKDKQKQNSNQEYLAKLRHSCAHIMAQAVQNLFEDVKVAIGPNIEEGFYYDFDLPHKFVPEDLPKIEQEMRRIAGGKHVFARSEKSREEALVFFGDKQEKYKVELINEMPSGETITFYQHDTFIDLCRGPHIESTKELRYFKLLSTSGAYWRGNEKNPMLQRIYGTAWHTKEDLNAYLKRIEEAKKRDHRKLGTELSLFSVHEEIGGGLIHWHPKGAMVRMLIEDLWRKEHLKAGYSIVYTPHIASEKIYSISGHLEAYSDLMYEPMDIEGRKFRLKPMNCPNHIMIYKTGLHSYRELPIRFAEMGTVYRFEKAGVLHGLMRVRGFTIDDAHIFMTHAQLEEEIISVVNFVKTFLGHFGFEDIKIYLSTRPEQFVGTKENWDRSTEALKNSLERQDLAYELDEGGGAFYGPKIDFKVKDSLGRLWQCSTIQLDFNLPQRFDVTYRDSSGKDEHAIMIHRALLGSIERFFGVLVEHYGGLFPFWLAPVQVAVISVNENTNEYANKVITRFKDHNIRAQIYADSSSISAKIRKATLEKIPIMAVVGEKEIKANSVNLRLHNGKNIGLKTLNEAIKFFEQSSANKKEDSHA